MSYRSMYRIPIKLKNTSPVEIPVSPQLPSGLYYIPNFITQAESETILSELATNPNWVGVTSSQNSRRVIHYGYLYSYTGGPLQPTDPIPSLYDSIRSRIGTLCSSTSPLCVFENPSSAFENPFSTVEKEIQTSQAPTFDQLIINRYLPGQSISPHTDHTTKFGPVIACLTLGSGVEIQFTRPKHESFKIYTEPNSLYIMSGDARYFWKHGIASKKSDTVDGLNRPRGTRISLTFRQA